VISPPRLGVGAVSAAPSAPSASAYGANIGSNPFAGYAPPPPASAGAYNAPPSNSSGSMQDESVQLREQNLLRREQMILDREKALETRYVLFCFDSFLPRVFVFTSNRGFVQ
jgi:hypothetical protein